MCHVQGSIWQPSVCQANAYLSKLPFPLWYLEIICSIMAVIELCAIEHTPVFLKLLVKYCETNKVNSILLHKAKKCARNCYLRFIIKWKQPVFVPFKWMSIITYDGETGKQKYKIFSFESALWDKLWISARAWDGKDCSSIIGIKHGFSCINIRQVPWEVLKTEAEGRGFQHLPRGLVNVNALKKHVRSLLLHKKHLLHFALFLVLFCFAFSLTSRERNFHGLCLF